MDSIHRHIDASPLQEFEKDILKSIFSSLNESDTADLSKLFNEKPALIPLLYINFLSKGIAHAKNDDEAFQNILEEELALLNKVDSQ
jgi:hypothetical protein